MKPTSIYDAAHFYDIAFGWRDVPAECDFMLARFRQAHRREATSALELACGPGQHARTFAARGLRAVGLDANPQMLAYARQQPGGDDPDLTWVVADMRNFALDEPVELACCLMDSLSHLLTLDDLLQHLRAVARNVVSGGLYVLDQSHPRDAFAQAEPATLPEWEMEDESGEVVVHTVWGEPDDPFDYTTQIGELTVTMQAFRDGAEIFHQQQMVPSRMWLAGEMEAAVRASGLWRLRERFGAMSEAISWQNEPPATRMVTVLGRIEE